MAAVRRNFGLDALRALAILLVLANHGARGFFESAGHLRWGGAWTAWSLTANISIEWLFALSGFLIGAMMIRTFEEAGTTWWRVRSFWLRRWFRTVPLYLLFLGVNAALVAWGIGPGRFTWWHAAFAQNLAWQHQPEFFGEAWSLATDEWFYFVAPLLVVAVAWRTRNLRVAFLAATAALIVLPTLARLLADVPVQDAVGDRLFHWDQDIRRVTIHHLDTTGWGVLAAVVSRWFPQAWSRNQRRKAITGFLLMAGGIYLLEELYWGGPVWDATPRLANAASLTLPGLGTFLALPWVASLRGRGGSLAAGVGWISLYSYTIYLVHLPVLFVLRHFVPTGELGTTWALTAAWLLILAAVSVALFHAFEKPMSDLRERFTRRVDANPFTTSQATTQPASPSPTPASTPTELGRGRFARLQAFLLARSPAWVRADYWITATAAGIVLLRWGARAATILSWDGATFALATERYDMNGLRPHAPGYPLFVLAAKLARPLVGGDANDALILVALLATAVAVVGTYWLGRTLLNRAAGFAASALLAASPVTFVHSVTANVYTADMACSVLVAGLAWRAHQQPGRGRILQLAIALAVSLGVRPSQAFFLAPVAAWGALRPPWTFRDQLRRLAGPAIAGAAVCLAWFLPMVRLSGGLATWRAATSQQSDEVVFGDTVFTGGWPIVVENLRRLHDYAEWEIQWVFGTLAVLMAFGLVASVMRKRLTTSPSRLAWTFLAVWLLPGFLFYALVFAGWGNGPSGYVLVLLPAALLATTLLADLALQPIAGATKPAFVALLACAMLATSLAGLVAHRHDVEDVGYREHDAWAAGWAGLPQSFPASNTSIVALWNFAYVWWAFPDYVTYNYRVPGSGPGGVPAFLMVQVAHQHEAQPDWYDAIQAGPSTETHPLPETTRHLVLFDFQLAGENGGERLVRSDIPVHETFLPNGWRVLYLEVTSDRPLLEDYFIPQGHATG